MGNKEQDSKAGTQRKSKGALQQWLQGASKKQKTKWNILTDTEKTI